MYIYVGSEVRRQMPANPNRIEITTGADVEIFHDSLRPEGEVMVPIKETLSIRDKERCRTDVTSSPNPHNLSFSALFCIIGADSVIYFNDHTPKCILCFYHTFQIWYQ